MKREAEVRLNTLLNDMLKTRQKSFLQLTSVSRPFSGKQEQAKDFKIAFFCGCLVSNLFPGSLVYGCFS